MISSDPKEKEAAVPAPRKAQHTELYSKMLSSMEEHGDANACALMAVSAATGTDYDVVAAHFDALGRKAGNGTSRAMQYDVLEALGFEFKRVGVDHFIQKYPPAHSKRLLNVTTHHPDRFPEAWKDGCAYLLYCDRHVCAVVDGVNHDWSRGRVLRVKQIFRVSRKTTEN